MDEQNSRLQTQRVKAIALYIDLTNFYQTVSPDLLQRLMTYLGFSADDIQLVMDLYDGASFAISLPSGASANIPSPWYMNTLKVPRPASSLTTSSPFPLEGGNLFPPLCSRIYLDMLPPRPLFL